MAKLAYNKLDLNKIVNKDSVIINFNAQDIEILQYLPIEKKLDLISKVVNESVDNNGYWNPCRVELYSCIEIILAYTNISITEKQRENIFKIYDNFINSGLYRAILDAIPDIEYNYIIKSIKDTIENIYKYKNYAIGILDAISTDYSSLDLDATEIQQKISDPQNMELLKDILTKLG